MDIYTLDLNFQNTPKTIAAYLVIGPEGPVLVETGPGSTRETLRARLADFGFVLSDVRHVLVSHIHLDHAGAAGWLAQLGAQIYVHHVGAPHLIDPSKLLTSAARIYGDQMDVLWGETLPAPAENVTAVHDHDVIDVAGLQFVAIGTPGHAWHHHTYRLGDIAFTGDAAGIRISTKGMVDLPAPPPEFKLEVWQQTINRLLSENFTAIYPTHFGRVDNVTDQLTGIRDLMQRAADFIHTRMDAGEARDQILDQYVAWNHDRARAHGLTPVEIDQYETANPIYMSVDGIMRYWRKWAAKQDK